MKPQKITDDLDRNKSNKNGNFNFQIATKSVETQVTIPKPPNVLTVMVKVLCQVKIVLQFIVHTDDGSWDGYVPEKSVLIMSSTSVLGEVRCYDYDYDSENRVLILKLALHLSIRSDLCSWRTKSG